MSNRRPEKNSDIWLKYCEECVKSKLENNDDKFSGEIKDDTKKKIKN